MAGLYIHIPFCKQACHYCDFHFSTSLRYRTEMVETLAREMRWRADYLPERKLQSVYLGGGTPSLLNAAELEVLFTTIGQEFELDTAAEITLEANPDDIQPAALEVWAKSPINRLSIGIQSFSEEDLRFMNRAHSAAEAEACLFLARAFDFHQLTVDLIYGSPTTSDDQWAKNLAIVAAADIPHLSCYALTVEPRTALAHQIAQGKALPVDEEQAARQFEQLLAWADAQSYEQYEISNFARQQQYAVHNTSYWQAKPYLGIGPSAHSFNGQTRQWNVANNARYLRAMATNSLAQARDEGLFEQELLTAVDRYNERIMTGLRTKWGVSPTELEAPYRAYFLQEVKQFVNTGMVVCVDNCFRLTPAGRLVADYIAGSLFYDLS
ncbi:MAG: radical SAM family heme chaperone HemW [Bacteroidetes bacterium]|nr:MAG: radical SAM family heme chaperone HemW [Bacteroidota bacterium]